MSKSTTGTPKTWRQERRLRAWALFQQGWRQRQIARALGVSEGAVSQWLTQARQAGSSALHDRPHPGRPSRLSPEQQARVLALLRRGAPAFGFRGDLWTRKRIREVIRREFGVTYSLSHISRLLRQWDWTRQKPVPCARQRDQAAIAAWREQQYPALVKRGHD